MTPNGGCLRLRRVALVLATIWLSGCATGASDGGGLGVCPPVLEYGRKFQARAAEELALLPEGAAIVEMLSDYAVMREQARECGVSYCMPFRRRERAMFRFRRMRGLQKFASAHASVTNHFNSERSLSSRPLFKNRAAALAEWRGLGTA